MKVAGIKSAELASFGFTFGRGWGFSKFSPLDVVMEQFLNNTGQGLGCTEGESCPVLGTGYTAPPVVCADVRHLCSEDTIACVRARQYCPRTCGCDSPTSKLILISNADGCPKSCRGIYQTAVESMPCVDAPTSEFTWWTKEVLRTSQGWPFSFKVGIRETMGFLSAHGCKGIAMARDFSVAMLTESQAVDLCHESGTIYNPFPVISLSSMCPITCRCAAGQFNCPAGCPVHDHVDHEKVVHYVIRFFLSFFFVGCEREGNKLSIIMV